MYFDYNIVHDDLQTGWCYRRKEAFTFRCVREAVVGTLVYSFHWLCCILAFQGQPFQRTSLLGGVGVGCCCLAGIRAGFESGDKLTPYA